MNHDFRVSVTFRNHSKTQDLIEALGFEGFYSLLSLWSYAATSSIDGVLPRQPMQIARAADWSGDPAKLVDALIEIGWIDHSEGEYRLHAWAEHQPYCSEAKARISRAQAAGRASAVSRKQKYGTAQPARGRGFGTGDYRTASSVITEPPTQPNQEQLSESIADTEQNRSDTEQTSRAAPVVPTISPVALGVHRALRGGAA